MSRQSAEELYRKTFSQEPQWVSCGPGRINLIGEHTDYSGGFVFPAAIDKEVWVAAGPAEGTECRLVSEGFGAGAAFTLESLSPDSPQEDWTKYPASIAWAAGAKTPIQAAVASTLPPESGVSSSAAIEMAFGVLWNRLDELGFSPLDLALLGQKGENQYVGMPCGVMDQMASALGREGHALFIDTHPDSLKADYAPLPPGVSIVLCNTGCPRKLVGGEYKERRDQVESAARKMGVSLLREADLALLERTELEDLERKRARHVITENDRCRAFAPALAQGDTSAIQRLMLEAHASMKNDFEATITELDSMVAACMEGGAIGARVTGAGFGGACVALVHTDLLPEFLAKTEEAYRRLSPHATPKLHPCLAAEGARVVSPM